MARRYELITELYERTRAAVTSPQEWQKFLTTACRNYKLPFDEQFLLYAQRPDATAVLEIEAITNAQPKRNIHDSRAMAKGTCSLKVMGAYA